MSRPLRVLIVEDHEADAALVVRALRQAGYDVDAQRVQTAAEMRAALEAHEWHVVIADYHLPQFDAPAALALLQETGLDLPFIVVSGTVGEDTVVAMMRAGAHDYLMKGNLARLAPAVERETRDAETRRQQREAEDALRASERRFSTVFRSSPLAIAIASIEDGSLIDVNEAWVGLTGVPREEALGRTAKDLGIWAVPAERDRIAQTLRERASVRAVEVRVRPRLGDERILLMSAEPIDLAGQRCMLTMAVDVTERRNAEEALAREGDLLNQLITNIPDHIYFKDRHSRFTKINPAQARWLGLADPADAVGKTDNDVFSSEHAQQAFADEQQVMATGQPLVGLEEKETWPDGRTTWASTTKVALRDRAGEIVGLFGVSRDVTERKRMEAALRASEERFRLVFQAMTDGIVLADVETGALAMVNPALCRMLGYTEEELLRLTVDDIHPEESLPAVREALRLQIAGEQPVALGIPVRRKDGSTFVADIDALRLNLGERQCLLGVVRDMTAFNELEQQLRQAQKMEAVGQLAGGVAHDFNNLLCVIQGHCDLILKGLRADDPLAKSVAQIESGSERAAGLTRQLLAFSRKQALQPEVLDLNATVRNLEGMLRRLIGEHIELVASLADPLGCIKADAGQIEQVIINLVVNARDAMPQGGKLLIETADVNLDEDFVSTQAGVRPGRYVLLAVSDTGCGMDARTRERIFEPFFTTKEKGKGTGLGLSTVYGIVRQSGGSIRVCSEVGRGSTFKVYLPCTGEVPAVRAGRPERGTRPGAGEHILVVEDEPEMREIVQEVLEDLGYRTTVAANGGEALLAVEEGRLRPDLLLTDVVMPGMSGSLLACGGRIRI
jgi:PAS domain S-box-containing protein